MAQGWRSKSWLKLVGAVTMGGAIATITSTGNPTLAQIKPDTTLGNEGSIVKSNLTKGLPGDQIDGGARRGVNLFHSFEEFNINQGRGAYFTNPTGIENILSRVTGGDRSDILGTLGVLGNANLFLLNPNGIIFGPDASLNIGGSFLASTANSLSFADGSQFNVTASQTKPLLTMSVPIGLQYGGNAGGIQVKRSSLQVPNGKTLALVGGDMNLNGGTLLALGGRVELGGVAGTGTVGLSFNGSDLDLSFPSEVRRANVSLVNGAAVDVTAGNAGSIEINARNLDILSGSFLRAGIGEGLGSVNSQAGDITLDATEAIRIKQSSRISNDLNFNATGNSGDIIVRAGSLSFSDASGFNLLNFGQGNAGQATIRVNGPVSFRDSSGAFAFLQGIGNGGDIIIQAGSLSFSNGSGFITSTSGQGNSGSVIFEVSGPVSFNGVDDNGLPSSIFSDSSAVVNGGDISIRASSLTLSDGAQLVTSTSGEGDAGNVTIETSGPVSLAGEDGIGFPSRISSNSEEFAVGGDGGNITIRASSLTLSDGTQLFASTEGQDSNAGSVTITARDTVSLNGVGRNGPTAAFTSVADGAVGNGGSINITTGLLSIVNRAQLNASSKGNGPAGNLVITASSIRLDNKAALSSNTIAGQGNIILGSEGLVLRRASKITTNATGTATGGSITIDTGVLAAFEDSDITANAEEAAGGRVEIDAQGIFRSLDSDITASSNLGPQFSGIVEINTPDVDPSEGVVALPDVPVNVEVAQGCQASSNQASVEFFNTGKGGLAPSPYEPLSSSGIWEDVQESKTLASTRSTDLLVAPPGKIVEAQGWLINEKGEATLVAKVPDDPSQQSCRLR